MKLYDISADLLTAAVYPGDPEPELRRVGVIGENADCNLSTLFCCLHNGTHMDAPLHFLADGKSAEQIAPERFIGMCRVVSAPPGAIAAGDVENLFPPTCERILIKGGGQTYFSADGAEALALRNPLLVGTDSGSVGFGCEQTAVHRAFLRREIALLEGLSLVGVPDGEYFLMAAPIKIGGAEAAPVRAFLADGVRIDA